MKTFRKHLNFSLLQNLLEKQIICFKFSFTKKLFTEKLCFRFPTQIPISTLKSFIFLVFLLTIISFAEFIVVQSLCLDFTFAAVWMVGKQGELTKWEKFFARKSLQVSLRNVICMNEKFAILRKSNQRGFVQKQQNYSLSKVGALCSRTRLIKAEKQIPDREFRQFLLFLQRLIARSAGKFNLIKERLWWYQNNYLSCLPHFTSWRNNSKRLRKSFFITFVTRDSDMENRLRAEVKGKRRDDDDAYHP